MSNVEALTVSDWLRVYEVVEQIGIAASSICTCHRLTGCSIHGPQPREHRVVCKRCPVLTWNISGVCDHCTRKDASSDPSPSSGALGAVDGDEGTANAPASGPELSNHPVRALRIVATREGGSE